MKIIIFYFFVIILSSLSTFSFSQNDRGIGNKNVNFSTNIIDTSIKKYFPLQAGNVYKYKLWDFPYPNNVTYYKARILKDSVILGIRYFYCKDIPSIQNGFVRYDSLSGLLLQFFPGNGCGNYPNDKIIDSLSAKLNNTFNYCPYNATFSRTCSDTSNITLFNYYTTKRKSFDHDGLILSNVIYAKNIGISNFGSGEPPPITHFVDLVGCYVNGILYGDTLMTEINLISSEVPSTYSLSQNYPNPFNPSTKISFSLPRWRGIKGVDGNASIVTLKVYNILGMEITALVNEKLNPGTYEVTFDGSNLNSGIYFYKLTSGNFSETRKMILMK